MNFRTLLPMLGVVALSACASLTPPSAEKLAALPMVIYPDKPPTGDFIYKLPAGKPIDLRILADGNLLATSDDQTFSASLAHDLYLHKGWASEDGRHWQPAGKLVDIGLTVTLPSYQTPGPGQIHLTASRKEEK